jgi:hypothetical protein
MVSNHRIIVGKTEIPRIVEGVGVEVHGVQPSVGLHAYRKRWRNPRPTPTGALTPHTCAANESETTASTMHRTTKP